MTREEILTAIYAALDRANALRERDTQLPLAEATRLLGQGGLDSLALVSLVLDVEEAVNAATGRAVVLADQNAVSQRRSPFADVQSFADYIAARLSEPA